MLTHTHTHTHTRVLNLGVLGIRAIFGLGWIYTHYVHIMKVVIIPYVVHVFSPPLPPPSTPPPPLLPVSILHYWLVRGGIELFGEL